jgi:DUF1680 family protein
MLYLNLYIGGEAKIKFRHKNARIRIVTKFPFDSKVKLHITSEDTSEMKLALRIPGYVKNFTIYSNNKEIPYEKRKGYAVIQGSFQNTELEIEMEIPPLFMIANPNVRENIGKVAIMKGPLVYCLEECDNGKNLKEVFVDTTQQLKEEYRPDLLGGIVTIKGIGKRISEECWDEDDLYKEKQEEFVLAAFVAVPYSLWCNRKPGEMIVWLKELNQ